MVRIITALVALLAASSAQADWQFTRWGMSPEAVDDGLKTSKLLNATYGPSDREERMGLNESYSGWIARRRWRVPRDGNLVTFFNLCGSRFEVRYEPIPRGGL